MNSATDPIHLAGVLVPLMLERINFVEMTWLPAGTKG